MRRAVRRPPALLSRLGIYVDPGNHERLIASCRSHNVGDPVGCLFRHGRLIPGEGPVGYERFALVVEPPGLARREADDRGDPGGFLARGLTKTKTHTKTPCRYGPWYLTRVPGGRLRPVLAHASKKQQQIAS